MQHRKAYVQLCAKKLAPVPPEELNMQDYVKACGGEIFANAMKQLVSDDHGLSKWVKILSLSTISNTEAMLLRVVNATSIRFVTRRNDTGLIPRMPWAGAFHSTACASC